ncbi:hypothetical protein KP696_00415 [Nocardia seriolae]|uniref:hypothetical protein n=1 Tax=Nocardia seriolae TaxID=37332 RepID=UPI0018AD1757
MVVVGVAKKFHFDSGSKPTCIPDDPDAAFRMARIDLPPSAVVESFEVNCDRFYNFDATIRMNSATVDSLLASSQFKDVPTVLDRHGVKSCHISDHVSIPGWQANIQREIEYPDCARSPDTVFLRIATDYPTPVS